jgi:FMN phosphatase YigB (HAD superfamily)
VAQIEVVFFDVGGTLGSVDANLELHLFPTTKDLLAVCRGVLGLRLGVMSNVPATLGTKGLKSILEKAGILKSFEPALIVTSVDAGAEKPKPAIYQFAAKKAGVHMDHCLYIGEDIKEVDGAVAAGMPAILKPVP